MNLLPKAFLLVYFSSFLMGSLATAAPEEAALREMGRQRPILSLEESKRWSETLPLEVWAHFVGIFRNQDWLVPQYNGADWVEAIPLEKLQEVLNGGELETVLNNTNHQGLAQYLPQNVVAR